MRHTNAGSRRARRAVAGAVAGTLLAGTALAVTATPAAAHEGGIEHWCGSLDLPDDDGPVTDLVHHGVEVPLGFLDSPIDGPGWYLLHSTNCQLAGLEHALLPPLGLPVRSLWR